MAGRLFPEMHGKDTFGPDRSVFETVGGGGLVWSGALSLDNDEQQTLVWSIVEEFVGRRLRGEAPTVDEYVRLHPGLADQLCLALGSTEIDGDGDGDGEKSGATRSFVDEPPELGLLRMPRQMGDFRLLRMIGRGGMGIVFEAEQGSLGRRVALKVLTRDTTIDRRQVERFQQEARAAARLHHTNIVPVFGVGECEGWHYYAMQLIRGQGLDALRRPRVAHPGAETRRATGPRRRHDRAGNDRGSNARRGRG